jgi:hypothetical protein
MIERELKFLATPEKGEVSALLIRPEGATHPNHLPAMP